MNIKRFILKVRLFFSPLFMRHKHHEEKGFIYEFDDEELLSKEKINPLFKESEELTAIFFSSRKTARNK